MTEGNSVFLDPRAIAFFNHLMTSRGSSGEKMAQNLFGSTRRAQAFYQTQMLDFLNPLMIEFIHKQEMVFIATSGANGECDSSLRAGLPGFVHVLDPKTLIYPEYRGNGVMASVGNILENPNIGLMFIDFFEHTIGLHVNGAAEIQESAEIQTRFELQPSFLEAIHSKGCRRPERWIVVTVKEAYIHCSKHIPLLNKLDKTIHWGTDNTKFKGGDFFKTKG